MGELAGLFPLVGQTLSIALIDLTLSGDNAAVIGLAIRSLPPATAKRAAIVGATGAVALRFVFTALATQLASVPYLGAFGAILLAAITVKLMMPGDETEYGAAGKERFWPAVGAIIVADLSMALDNVLAVAGAAHGNTGLVLFGLGLSVPILIWGSTWVAETMRQHPVIIYIGAAVLAHTAGAMLFGDKALNLPEFTGRTAAVLLPWTLAAGVIIYGLRAVRGTRSATRQKRRAN